MTDTSTSAPVHVFGQGRKPPHPPGHPLRLAIPWLHELDPETADSTAVTYPLDLTGGKTSFPMWGNGPDTTLTITDAEGAPGPQGGQPVGDCHFAGTANDEFLDGNPNGLTANVVVGCYDQYEADSQGVPLGQEQDDGVVMSDALRWCLTHNWQGQTVPLGEGIVRAFVPVAPGAVPATMAKYRRPLLTGVNLTDCDQQNFPNWTVNAGCQPNPQEGHVVLLALLRAAPVTPGHTFGPAGPLSWEQVVNADEAWMNAAPEEFWMPVTEADEAKMGSEAYNYLIALMATLPGFEGVTPSTPTPPPAPEPSPAPPSPPKPPTPAPTPPNPAVALLKRLAADVKAAFTSFENAIDKLLEEPEEEQT